MPTVHKNLLLVEGEQDKRVIPYLIEENGIPWGNTKNPIVFIEAYGGDSNLLDPLVISTELKARDRQALGLIVDADDNLLGRWQGVRHICLQSMPDLPETLPATGLIHTAPNGVRFGVWIMPDNQQRGMLETFLAELLPEEKSGGEKTVLWDYAQQVVQQAKTKGAPFGDTHFDKANIYTWLAWQKPPGRQLHEAVKEHILTPCHPKAQVFLNWFQSLYGV